MTRFTAVLALLTGCSVARIEEMPIEGHAAEVGFMAVRGKERITSGYCIDLRSERGGAVFRACDPDRPVPIGEFEPGRYTAVITGQHVKHHEIPLELKAG